MNSIKRKNRSYRNKSYKKLRYSKKKNTRKRKTTKRRYSKKRKNRRIQNGGTSSENTKNDLIDLLIIFSRNIRKTKMYDYTQDTKFFFNELKKLFESVLSEIKYSQLLDNILEMSKNLRYRDDTHGDFCCRDVLVKLLRNILKYISNKDEISKIEDEINRLEEGIPLLGIEENTPPMKKLPSLSSSSSSSSKPVSKVSSKPEEGQRKQPAAQEGEDQGNLGRAYLMDRYGPTWASEWAPASQGSSSSLSSSSEPQQLSTKKTFIRNSLNNSRLREKSSNLTYGSNN